MLVHFQFSCSHSLHFVFCRCYFQTVFFFIYFIRTLTFAFFGISICQIVKIKTSVHTAHTFMSGQRIKRIRVWSQIPLRYPAIQGLDVGILLLTAKFPHNFKVIILFSSTEHGETWTQSRRSISCRSRLLEIWCLRSFAVWPSTRTSPMLE